MAKIPDWGVNNTSTRDGGWVSADVASSNPLNLASVSLDNSPQTGSAKESERTEKESSTEKFGGRSGENEWLTHGEAFFNKDESSYFRRLDFPFVVVLVDFVWERTRSRALTILVYALAALDLFLLGILPQLSLPSIDTCWGTVKALSAQSLAGFSPIDSVDSNQEALAPVMPVLYVLTIVSALLGAHTWNILAFLPLSFLISLAYVSLNLGFEAPYCARLALLVPTLVTVKGTEQTTSVVAFYRWCRTVFLMLVVILQLIQTSKVVMDIVRGRAPFSVLWKNSPCEPPSASSTPSPRPSLTTEDGPLSVDNSFDGGGSPARLLPPLPPSKNFFSSLLLQIRNKTSECYRKLCDELSLVPTRHLTAVLLSFVGILVTASILYGWARVARDELDTIRAFIPRDAGEPPSEFVRGVVQIMRDYLPAIWQDGVFRVLESALVWGSVGIWVSTSIFLTLLLTSIFTVAGHVRLLREDHRREAALAGAEAAPRAAGEEALKPGWGEGARIPPLLPAYALSNAQTHPYLSMAGVKRFSVFDATQYSIAHLATHVFTFLVFTIFVTSFTTALAVYISGVSGDLRAGILVLLGLVFNASRSQIFIFLTFKLPPILMSILPSLLLCCGIKRNATWSRRVVGFLCLLTRWMDGSNVLTPRLFLLADTVLSFTVGPILALADAFTRVVIGVVWGLLKISVLSEPVVPLLTSGFDRAFMSYGGTLRVSTIPYTDGLTEGLPPAKAKYSAL